MQCRKITIQTENSLQKRSMKFERVCNIMSASSALMMELKGEQHNTPVPEHMYSRYKPHRSPHCSASLEPTSVQRRIQVSFEFPLKGGKGSSSTSDSTNPPTTNQPMEQPNICPHTIDPTNPIFKFLRPDDLKHVSAVSSTVGNGTYTADTKTKGNKRNSSSSGGNSCHLVSGHIPTCTVWNMRSVAPLIRWLHLQGVRYTHSDWEVQMNNGERERVTTQHGHVLSDIQTVHHKSYLCHGGFHPHMLLRFVVDEIVDTVTTTKYPNMPNWWMIQATPIPIQSENNTSESYLSATDGVNPDNPPVPVSTPGSSPAKQRAKSSLPKKSQLNPVINAPLYDSGKYHNIRQHRTYQWDNQTTLHLYTTDSKHYRVTIEHWPDSVVLDPSTHGTTTESFRKLVNDLAYHFSQHVRRQRGI